MIHLIFRINADHPCLAGHFPENPIVPGVLILDHIIAKLMKKNIMIKGILQIKFIRPVKPNEWIHVEYDSDNQHIAAFVLNEATLTGYFT